MPDAKKDAKKQERRRRELKLREAGERKEEEREQAGWMYTDAQDALRDGDLPAAARLAKKALVLDPQHVGALNLLSRIYFEADEHAVALPYIRQFRKLRPDDPGAAYNSGAALQKLGQRAEALAEFEVALALINTGPQK